MNLQVFVREYIFQCLMCNNFSSLSVAPERGGQRLSALMTLEAIS